MGETKFLRLLCIGVYLFCLGSPILGQNSNAPIPLIIDADTANEVDDLFAIVRALNEPSFRVLGITSAQFHTSPLATANTVEESQKLNEEIIGLTQIKGIDLPLGSNTSLVNRSTPSISSASNFIVAQANQFNKKQPLNIVVLGSCTNISSAILQDPAIIPKIKVHYLGFWHDPIRNTYDKQEFNTGNDSIAVEVLLDTKGLDLSVMTATTSENLVLEKKEVDLHLKGKGSIADYLVKRWETYTRWWTKEDPGKNRWIMWDLALIEALARPSLVKKRRFKTPSKNIQRDITIYTEINVEDMIVDFWRHMNYAF